MTTYEVELKVRAAHEPVRDALADRDAERVAHVRQRDTYYDAPDRDFAETDEALRIRREHDLTDQTTTTDTPDADDGPETDSPAGPDSATDETVRLTYKGPLVDESSKTREEAETTVGDGETADSILRGLGYEPAARVTKRRETFAVGAYHVTLDTVEGLGEFVEIDREVTENVERAREEAARLLRELGLDPADGIRTSYLGLLLAESD
ncbi:MAG: class IV adenylate cyclase [Halobaculum sp.]